MRGAFNILALGHSMVGEDWVNCFHHCAVTSKTRQTIATNSQTTCVERDRTSHLTNTLNKPHTHTHKCACLLFI